MIELVLASPGHVGRIANCMRDADRAECLAHGLSPKAALRMGLRASVFVLTAKVDGVPAAMFGVSPLNGIEGTGRPWLLGTDAVFGCARALLNVGPEIIAAMHVRFRRLENAVWSENDAAVRLLRRWGFQVEEEVEMIGGLPFKSFWREG